MSMNMPGGMGMGMSPMGMDGTSAGVPQAFSQGQGQGGAGGGQGGGGGGGQRRGPQRYVAREENIVANPMPMMQLFKNEVAAELGLQNYDQMDKGWLASRQNGYVGGNMTKKMVAYAEAAISQQGPQNVIATTTRVIQIQPQVLQMNQLASRNFQQYVQTLNGALANQFGTLGSGTGAAGTTGVPMDGMTMGMTGGMAPMNGMSAGMSGMNTGFNQLGVNQEMQQQAQQNAQQFPIGGMAAQTAQTQFPLQ